MKIQKYSINTRDIFERVNFIRAEVNEELQFNQTLAKSILGFSEEKLSIRHQKINFYRSIQPASLMFKLQLFIWIKFRSRNERKQKLKNFSLHQFLRCKLYLIGLCFRKEQVILHTQF